jgi:hypothetical protein
MPRKKRTSNEFIESLEKEFSRRFGISYSQFRKKSFGKRVSMLIDYVCKHKEDPFSYIFLKTMAFGRDFEGAVENALTHATEDFKIWKENGDIPWKAEEYERCLELFVIHYKIFTYSKEELKRFLPNLT